MIAHSIVLDQHFDEAIEKVTSELADQGFGVITRIDMQETFANKLGVAFRPYTILGACNPGLAHKAVSERPEIGLMLPCNVTVEEVDAGVRVLIPDAKQLLSGIGHEASDALDELSRDAGMRLSKVAEALRA